MSALVACNLGGEIKKASGGGRCYDTRMNLSFDPKGIRSYEIEFGAAGQRLGCTFHFDDGSLTFIHESEMTDEVESLMASLGSPTEGSTPSRSR